MVGKLLVAPWLTMKRDDSIEDSIGNMGTPKFRAGPKHARRSMPIGQDLLPLCRLGMEPQRSRPQRWDPFKGGILKNGWRIDGNPTKIDEFVIYPHICWVHGITTVWETSKYCLPIRMLILGAGAAHVYQVGCEIIHTSSPLAGTSAGFSAVCSRDKKPQRTSVPQRQGDVHVSLLHSYCLI